MDQSAQNSYFKQGHRIKILQNAKNGMQLKTTGSCPRSVPLHPAINIYMHSALRRQPFIFFQRLTNELHYSVIVRACDQTCSGL